MDNFDRTKGPGKVAAINRGTGKRSGIRPTVFFVVVVVFVCFCFFVIGDKLCFLISDVHVAVG